MFSLSGFHVFPFAICYTSRPVNVNLVTAERSTSPGFRSQFVCGFYKSRQTHRHVLGCEANQSRACNCVKSETILFCVLTGAQRFHKKQTARGRMKSVTSNHSQVFFVAGQHLENHYTEHTNANTKLGFSIF